MMFAAPTRVESLWLTIRKHLFPEPESRVADRSDPSLLQWWKAMDTVRERLTQLSDGQLRAIGITRRQAEAVAQYHVQLLVTARPGDVWVKVEPAVPSLSLYLSETFKGSSYLICLKSIAHEYGHVFQHAIHLGDAQAVSRPARFPLDSYATQLRLDTFVPGDAVNPFGDRFGERLEFRHGHRLRVFEHLADRFSDVIVPEYSLGESFGETAQTRNALFQTALTVGYYLFNATHPTHAVRVRMSQARLGDVDRPIGLGDRILRWRSQRLRKEGRVEEAEHCLRLTSTPLSHWFEHGAEEKAQAPGRSR